MKERQTDEWSIISRRFEKYHRILTNSGYTYEEILTAEDAVDSFIITALEELDKGNITLETIEDLNLVFTGLYHYRDVDLLDIADG